MQLSRDDEDLSAAFALAQNLAAHDPIAIEGSETDKMLQLTRACTFMAALQLYAVSLSPDILDFLRRLCECTVDKRTRGRLRKYLQRVGGGEYTQQEIIFWAIESSVQSAIAILRPTREDKEPAAHAPISLVTGLSDEEFIEGISPQDIPPPDGYVSWTEFYNAHIPTMDAFGKAIVEKDLDQACVLLDQLPSILPTYKHMADDAATLAIEQNQETIAVHLIERMSVGKQRSMLLLKLYRATKKKEYKDALVASLKIEGDTGSEIDDERWKVRIARILSKICQDPTIGRDVEEQWQKRSPFAEIERRERERQRIFHDLEDLLRRFADDPSLRPQVEQYAERLTNPSDCAFALLHLWDKTHNLSHLEIVREVLVRIPINREKSSDDRGMLLSELAWRTKDPNDLELWRQTIPLMDDPLHQLEALADLCAKKVGLE